MISKLFKWVSARIVAAFALALPLAAWAAPTATAVWRSNLGQSYTVGGHTYAVTPRDGTLNQDGTISVSSTWGDGAPYIDLEGTGVGIVSVLVKYSGLDISQIYEDDAQSVGVAFASIIDSDNNVVGSCVQKVNGVANNTVRAYHCGASAASATPRDIGNMTAVEGSGYLLFAFKDSQGSRSYMGTSIDNLTGGEDTAGHWSDRNLKKLVLGGDESGKAFNGAGFKIEEVAIFVGSYLTASDVADYVFPAVNVDTTSSMTMTELNTKVAAFGENTFNYFSASPVVTYDVAPSDATTTYLRSALWNGTVFIKDQNIVNLNPTIYGNPNSTLKLSGVSGHWGGAVYEKTATPAIELEDSETEGREYGYFASNGYSFYSQGAYYYVHTPELKGSGTYKANTTGNGALFVADKFDNFTGKLNLEGKTVWLGTGAPTKSVDTWNNQVNFPGTVRLGSAIPANYSTWNVPNGYKGTVVLTAAASEQYQVNFLTSSTWKGTCQLNWNATGKLDIVNYGNANSVIEIPSTFSALPTQNGGSDGAEIVAEVKITGSWTVSDGWTQESYRTTFAKLSGAGTLTVNGGSGGVGDPIPYTITRLEGFTGTVAGTRGKFTIGTIVAATEPTPGTKLVNFTTANAPILDSTKVVYNNAEQDVDLEFKAGDGIYVKAVAYVVFQQASGQSLIDVTNYYATVANAIDAAKSLKKTVVLVAQPDAADTYNISAGETINVKKGEFTFDGIIFPEGAQYNNTTTETAGVTQYKCAVNTATIQYPGEEPVGMPGQLIQILGGLYSGYVPGYAGTVVTVLDGSDATLGDVMPDVFTYNSEAHTYTLKTMVTFINTGYVNIYYPTLAAAIEAATAGQTVTLLADDHVSFSAGNLEIAISKALTIDGAGYTVYGVNDYAYDGVHDHDIYISGSGDVTIKNVTLANFAGGVSNNMRTYPIWTGSAYAGTLTLDNVTVQNFNRTAFNLNGGTVVVKDCTITGDTSKDSYFQSGIEAYNANVTVQGTTTITGTGSNLVDWPEAACLQLGNPNGSVAGTGSITVTGGTFTGDYGIIVASNASEVVSVTGGTFNGVLEVEDGEGGSLAISGGTFDAEVPAEYCADGYEPKDNGDGTYGVRTDLGWIYEAADHPKYTGTWSKDLTYDVESHKAAIEDGNTYTAARPSDGRFVTLNMTLSFDGVNDDDTDLSGAKAAVRLGEDNGNYVFQLATTGTVDNVATQVWANATGFSSIATDADYTFLFVLDLTNKTYTASVITDAGATTNALSVAESTEIAFANQGEATAVREIEFIGSGTLTSLTGSYEAAPEPEDFVEDEEVSLSDGTADLTAGQAAWLNDCGAKAVVSSVLSGMSSDAFNKAYLLNLNITGNFSYEFTVSAIEVKDSTVDVTVTLTRTGALADNEVAKPIIGTLTLKGTAALGTEFQTIGSQALEFDEDADFGEGATTTVVTIDTSKTDAKFYQPTIE